MASRTVEALRSRYPALRDKSDKEITVTVGKKFPRLAEEDPDFAKDYSLFTRNPVAGALEDLGKSFIASAVYDTGTAAWSVVENVAKAFSSEVAEYAREQADDAAIMSQELRESGDLAFGLSDKQRMLVAAAKELGPAAAKGPLDLLRSAVSGEITDRLGPEGSTFDRGVDQDSMASKVGSGAGSLVPMMAGGTGVALGSARALGVGLSALPKAAQTAAAATSYGISGLQSFGSTYQQARKGYEEQGFSEEDAAAKAVPPAAAQGTLDILLAAAGGKVASKLGAVDLEKLWMTPGVRAGIDKLAKGSAITEGAKAGVKPVLKAGTIEGAEESASAFIGSYLIAQQSYNPDVTLEESLLEAWDSFLVGGILGGGMATRPGYRAYKQRKSAVEEAKRNNLRKTSPATANKLDQMDAQREREAANDVLPIDAQQPLEEPDRKFAEANKDVPMGGRRPVEELPELPTFTQPELSREEREKQLAERFEQLRQRDEAEAQRLAAEEEAERRAEAQAAPTPAIETDPAAVDEVEVSTIQRVMEGQANIDEASRPLTTIQISEAAESELQQDNLNDTQRKAVNRLQDRKAELVAESVNADPLRLDEILDEIDVIDSNTSQLIPGVPVGVQRATPQQLAEFQQAYNEQATAEPEPQQPEAPAFDPLKVGDDVIDVDGEIDGQLRSTLSKALNQVKRQFGNLSSVKRIVVEPMTEGAGLASAARIGDTETIYIDPARLNESVKNRKFSLEKAIEEEAIHNMDAQALKAEYASLLSRGEVDSDTTVSQFIQQRYQSIADGMTADEKARTRKIYGADFVDDVHMAQEFSRQLIQKKHTDAVTEDAKRNPILRQIFEAIERFLSGAKKLSGAAKAHLDQVEKFLLDSYSAEVADAAVAEEQRADAVKKKQQLAKNKFAEEDEDRRKGLLFMERAQKALRIVTGKDLQDPQGKRIYDAMLDKFQQLDRDGEVDSDDGVPKVAFFKTIAQKRLVNIIEEEQADKRKAKLVSMDAPVSNDSPDPRQVADPSSTPEAQSTEFGESLYEMIQSRLSEIGLTDLEADTFRRVLNRESQEEIAESRGVSPPAVSQMVRNATRKIANYGVANPEFSEILEDIGRELGITRGRTYASQRAKGLMDHIFDLMRDPKKSFFTFGKIAKGAIRNPLKQITDPTSEDSMLNLFRPMIEKDAYIGRVMNTVRYRRRDLAEAIRETYGEPSPKILELINDHLHGVTVVEGMRDIEQLPEPVDKAVRAMRAQIDSLSQYMLDQGYVDGDLKAKISENLGMYVARSFRIFDDPNYVDTIPENIQQAAINYVAKQLAGDGMVTESHRQEARQAVADLLTELGEKGQEVLASGGGLGKVNLDLFRKRKEIAPEIRSLLGEYTDPDVNYARTVTRMAQFVANRKFQHQLLKLGESKIFWDAGDVRRWEAQASSQIPDTPSYGPLAGKYTTAEVAALLKNYDKASRGMMGGDGIYGAWMQLNAATKSLKTVGSLMTHMRNAIGQPFFLVMNGHLDLIEGGARGIKNFKTIWADAAGTDKAAQAYFNKLTNLGLVGEELTTSELRRTLGQYSEQLNLTENPNSAINAVLATNLKKVWNKTAGAVTRVYRASDELGKIVAFEMEVEKLSNLPTYAGMPKSQIEKLAAERVRMTMPTYSEIPPLMQHIAAQPLVGPFMSFAYESMRTQVNNVRIIQEELANGNTKYAMSRAGGHLAVTAAYAAAWKMISALLGGVGEEEQEAIRELMADYEQNSVFLFYKGDKGKTNYINVSFNNPYSGTTDALLTLFGFNGLRGDGSAADHIVQSAMTAFDPFTSETIISSGMIDVLRNQDQYGNRVYNPEGSGTRIAGEVMGHFLKAFLPGTVERAYRRWLPASQGETIRSGESPTLMKELASEISGLRLRTIDYADKLQRIGYSNKRRISDANRIFNEIAGSRGTQSNESMLSAYEDANDSRYRVFQSVRKQIEAARLGGLTDSEIRTALKGNGMSAADINFIMADLYRPMPLSSQIIRAAIAAKHPIPVGQINLIKRKYAGRELSSEDDN